MRTYEQLEDWEQARADAFAGLKRAAKAKPIGALSKAIKNAEPRHVCPFCGVERSNAKALKTHLEWCGIGEK